MKKLFVLYTLTILSLSIFAQSQKDPAVSVSIDRDQEGHMTYTANNKDYCPYYIILNFTDLRGYTLNAANPFKKAIRTGKSNLFKLRKIAGESGSSGYSWYFYKGDPNAKLNLDYIYTLPVKSNDSIRFRISKGHLYGMSFNMKHANDTVYAARAGVVCNNDLYDSSTKNSQKKEIITVYHKDGSFSTYAGYNTPLTEEGKYIEVGQPIAIIKPNDKNQKWLHFSIYFLDKNKLKEQTGLYSALIPTFRTANMGDTKLDEKMAYVATITDDLKTQDMSKKEKEKYFKKNAK